jgi:hypothetical protein
MGAKKGPDAAKKGPAKKAPPAARKTRGGVLGGKVHKPGN